MRVRVESALGRYHPRRELESRDARECRRESARSALSSTPGLVLSFCVPPVVFLVTFDGEPPTSRTPLT